MKSALWLMLFCFVLLHADAQPGPEKIDLSFTIQVDSLDFQKGYSNIQLKLIKPQVIPGYAFRRFHKSEFEGDQLDFSVSVSVNPADTLVFELIHSSLDKSLKVVVANVGSYRIQKPGSDSKDRIWSYRFDLNRFFMSDDLSFSMFYDLDFLINAFSQTEDEKFEWKGHTIQSAQNGTLHISLHDFGLATPDGFMMFSYQQTLNVPSYKDYHHLRFQDYFQLSNNSLSGQVIHKPSQKQSLKQMEYKGIRKQKRKENAFNRLDITYTFYADQSFMMEVHGPGREVSIGPEYSMGMGIWELVGNTLILSTPQHWHQIYSRFDSGKFTEIRYFNQEVLRKKAKKLRFESSFDSMFYLKAKKTKGINLFKYKR